MTEHRDGGRHTTVDKRLGRVSGPRSTVCAHARTHAKPAARSVSAPLFQTNANGPSAVAFPTGKEPTVGRPPSPDAPAGPAAPDIDWP